MSGSGNWRRTGGMSAVEAAMTVAEYRAANSDVRHDEWELHTANTQVYFLRCGKYVKIGLTKNVHRRVGQLQSANPRNLELLLAVRGNAAYETFLHAFYHKWRVRGEWFEFKPAIEQQVKHDLEVIEQLKGAEERPDIDAKGVII